MSEEKKMDFVIFGATGYTGRLAVQEIANIEKKYPGIKWGVAGRSRDKLTQVLQEANEKTGLNTTGVKIIIADVNDEQSLYDMCDGVKVVVNCCGPYVKYGEPVVAAAVTAKSHYIDVSAENQFTKLLEEKYGKMAKEAGIYIINSCGLSSVPVDLGVTYLEQNFEGTLNSVESYLTTHPTTKSVMKSWKSGVIKYSTWEGMVHGMAHKKQSDEDFLKPFQPPIQKRSLLHRRNDRWCVPYPISDSFIVSRSQKHLFQKNNKRPVQYKPYLVFPNFFIALATLILFLFVNVLAKMTFTRKLLLNYPRLCSFGMVAYERDAGWAEGEAVYEYVLIGNGWDKNDDITAAPDKKIIANITVCGEDPAFSGTVAALLRCALTVVREEEHMPSEGGVMTPGYAFYKTDLLHRLQETTYKYNIKTTS